MKKAIIVCGWGYVLVFALLVVMVVIGFAAFGIGAYGWLQGDCDWAAYLGMGGGFLAALFAILELDKIGTEMRVMIDEEEKEL